MKFFFDFFPVLLFFIAYKVYDIYVATAVAIGASFLVVAFSWLKNRRVEPMHLIMLALLVVMGGATIYLQDERFIKWKPTLVNWLFGIAFLGSQFIGKRPFIERMLTQSISLPAKVWQQLNLSWALFFILLGSLNIYVAFNFDTDTWVNFKLFGMLGLTIAFTLLQALFLSRYLPKPEE